MELDTKVGNEVSKILAKIPDLKISNGVKLNLKVWTPF